MVALIISVASAQAQKSQVIAHRGYWKTAGSAQNSITALQKADSIHCYGSEFDVWLTKDNKLVINHDPVYKMKYMEYSKGAVQEILALVTKLGLENRMEYITFSLHAMKEFIRLAPAGTPVFYLNGELSPKELKDLGAAGLDYHMGVIKKHPEWIKEAHDLGLKVNVWTVDKAEDMKWLIDQKVDFITTNEPTVAQEILK